MDPDDTVVSSSSSESETEADEDEYPTSLGTSAEELTLQDDEQSPLLVQPPEDLGEAQGGEDTDLPYEEEGEGEGTEEVVSEPVQDAADKKDLEKKKKKKKKKKFLYICLTNCKYDVVRRTARRFGFKEVSEDEDWSLYWTDFSVALERVMDMKKYQGRTKKINHFPGMNEICRKDLLARNLNRMLKMFPKEYNIFPKTWCLPADYGDFQAYTRQKKNKTYILKPESGCQGRGIWITRNPKDIKPHEHMICQVYTNKPYLIDGFKFDLRIYTLVTSCDPLRIFVFKDGLARFATNKYCEPTHNNTDNVYMHLTNYAINKNSEDFVRDDEAGSKRRISTINKFLAGKGVDVEKMWNDIDDTIIKTLISAHSVLKHNYRTCFPNHVKGSACFEILGFDVLLDKRLRPYIIEVNHSPSFSTDAQLDREIKGTLIWDTLGLINFGAIDRRRCLEEERRRIKDRLLGKNTKKETKEELEVAQQQYLEQLERYEDTHLGNFRRIFPVPGCEKYDKYFHSSGTLFQETAAFRARTELARQQREEILRKKEKMEQMLKKGKRGEGGMRPESPTTRRKRPTWHRNPTSHFRPRFTQHSHHYEDRSYNEEAVDTRVPMDIQEEEELERISGLLQRDNLVRGLGIVEHVYRLLHCTPGTVGIVKPEPKPQPLPLHIQRSYTAVKGTTSTTTTTTHHQAGPNGLPLAQALPGPLSHSLPNPNPHCECHYHRHYYAHRLSNALSVNCQNNAQKSSSSSSSPPPPASLLLSYSGFSTAAAATDSHAHNHHHHHHHPPVLSLTTNPYPTHPPLSPSTISLVSDLPQPPLAEGEGEEEEIGGGGRRGRSGGARSRGRQRPDGFSGGLSAPGSSSYSGKLGPSALSKSFSALLPPRRSSSSSASSSRFSVHAPPSSSLVSHSPLSSQSFAASTSFRIPSSSLPFSSSSIILPPASAPPPDASQSVCVCPRQPAPGGSQQRWPMKSKSLGNLNERTIPAYQRNKLARKPMAGGGGVGNRSGVVVQETDLRSMTGMMDTEAERNRLLARNGYTYHQASYANPHPGGYSSGYQSDWRSDSSTPARTRVLSAHRQRDGDGGGLTRFIAQHPSHGLSVVSAPAPVVQRPDVVSPNNPLTRNPPVHVTGSGLEMVNTTRSTKSQRIRGASNNMRLRQIEMRENHAFVFS